MRTAFRFFAIVAIGTIFSGCNGKGGEQPQATKVEQRTESTGDKDLALKFLKGVQDGDKNKMYEAANLTTDVLNDSREKLIHPAQYKQTDQQRKDSEHALRTSGNIDFFSAKMKKIIPKSAALEVTETKVQASTAQAKELAHAVKITYANKAEAVIDKTGKPIKEMVVHLLQISRSANGHWIHEFSLNGKDFEKIADKEFEVVSYF